MSGWTRLLPLPPSTTSADAGSTYRRTTPREVERIGRREHAHADGVIRAPQPVLEPTLQPIELVVALRHLDEVNAVVPDRIPGRTRAAHGGVSRVLEAAVASRTPQRALQPLKSPGASAVACGVHQRSGAVNRRSALVDESMRMRGEQRYTVRPQTSTNLSEWGRETAARSWRFALTGSSQIPYYSVLKATLWHTHQPGSQQQPTSFSGARTSDTGCPAHRGLVLARARCERPTR